VEKFSRLLFWPLLLDQELLRHVHMRPWQHCPRTMAYLLLEEIYSWKVLGMVIGECISSSYSTTRHGILLVLLPLYQIMFLFLGFFTDVIIRG
jgi:hypothetical protein